MNTGFCMTGQDLFGRYARIAYGHAVSGKQNYHIYKCIQTFKSNCYCDTPLTYQTENNCYSHEDVTDVVNVIHCGIDESRVIRVALKDIELLPTLSPDDLRPVGKWEQKEIFGVEKTTIEQMQSACCSVCGKYHTTPYSYYFSKYNYCPNCGARMKGADA